MKKLLILLMCCLLLTACVQQKEVTGNAESNHTTENQNQEAQPDHSEESNASAETSEAPTAEHETITIQIYIPDENYNGFIAVDKEILELDENTIIDELVKANVLTKGIFINSLTQEETTLHIDFNADFGNLMKSQGTTGERMIMGCVVNTFLRAYNAESVLITVDGEILESGHVIYEFPMTFFE